MGREEEFTKLGVIIEHQPRGKGQGTVLMREGWQENEAGGICALGDHTESLILIGVS